MAFLILPDAIYERLQVFSLYAFKTPEHFFFKATDLHLHLLGLRRHCELFPLLIKGFFPEEKPSRSNSNTTWRKSWYSWYPWGVLWDYTHIDSALICSAASSKARALALRSSSLWILVSCFSSPDTCHIVGKSCTVGTSACRNSLLALLKIIWKGPSCAGFSLH